MGKERVRKTDDGWVAFCDACGWESEPVSSRAKARIRRKEHLGFCGNEPAKVSGKAIVEKTYKKGDSKPAEAKSPLKRVEVMGRTIEADASGEGDVLGSLFWFSVAKLEIPVNDLKKLCKKVGLVFDDVFTKIERRNVYMTVTSSISERTIVNPSGRPSGSYTYRMITGKKIKKEYKDLELSNRRNTETTRCVEETFLKDEHSLPVTYPIGAWDFENKNIITLNVDNEPEFKKVIPKHALKHVGPLFKKMDKKLRDGVEYYMDVYTEKQVRDGIRDFTVGKKWEKKSIKLRPTGGVYFTTKEYEADLAKVSLMMDAINEDYRLGRKSQLFTVPVVNGEKEKDLLYYKFEDYAVSELEKLITEMNEKIKAGKDKGIKISGKAFKTLRDRALKLKEIKQRYEDLLTVEFDQTEFKLDAVEGMLMNLTDYVRES